MGVVLGELTECHPTTYWEHLTGARKTHWTEVRAAANAMSNVLKDSKHPEASAASLALTPRRRGQQWAWLLSVLNWLPEQTGLQLHWSLSSAHLFVVLIAEVHVLHSPRPKHSPGFIAQSQACLHSTSTSQSMSLEPGQTYPVTARFLKQDGGCWRICGGCGADWLLLPMLHFLTSPLLLFLLYDLR